MPKLLFTILMSLIFFTGHSTETDINEFRTEKDIKGLCKKGKKQDVRSLILPNDGVVFYNKFAKGKEVSLRTGINSKELNTVENHLLEIFDDVIIHSNFPKCYFVKDEGKIGVCRFDGTILVPPVNGVPRHLEGTYNKFIWIGDILPWSDYQQYCASFVKDKYDIGAGEFQAVLDKQTAEIVIPYGKYDFISVSNLGYGNFLCCKKSDSGYLWGVVDKNGEEVVDCIYSGLRRTNKKGLMNKTDEWEGDNSFDLFAHTQNIRQRIADRDGLFDTDFFGKLVTGLKKFGDGIIKLDASLRESGLYDYLNQQSNYSYVNTYDNSSYSGIQESSSYNAWNSDNKYDLSEQRSYNLDKRTYASYDSMLSNHFAGNRPASASEVKDWQQKMKSLRIKWEKKGKSFPKSSNENR